MADLIATADAYKPNVHEAPLVVGHPQLDAPAFGWVVSLQVEGDLLLAETRQVDESFAEMVRQGRFKKVSASFYLPDSPRNPQPGVYYLRHVGFLGAEPPAIKGLPDPAFADGPEGGDTISLEYCEMEGAGQRGGVLHRLRQWIALRFGQAEAETVVPEACLVPEVHPAFSEREQQLETRHRQQEQREEAWRQQRVVEFVESLVGSGQLVPAEREHWVAMLNLVGQREQVAFGEEGEGSLASWLRQWLSQRPVVVQYSELAGDTVAGWDEGYQTPVGYRVEAGSLALHQRILAYSRQSGSDYVTAMRAVRNCQGE
ncbi:MAG: peptidase [Magnetococcales bacterium]|nr:peptidase [Magnetococcales bacterium]NGZ26105.1 peptidase [Magnetococcales bacterium]